ncbi:alpha/beta fold hydrolase [Pseudobacteriovorax antillogorgiicola]|uniref:Lysophospholipase n=1 Tax=Pseudobacteriovorax antillogorgiicola TaxID=1513793 RepID=A0A1Y6CJD3_9BACT|nr:alpha/beta hydrolase [Pseudobacteriovorax antillogorgiicola]TCS47906.1 lysophospholipase [Pseudobacteriovorax antillogorgiicola]SMF57821.1 lysophospholipase [Pseudobacteriovorax antillogorgiicola]
MRFFSLFAIFAIFELAYGIPEESYLAEHARLVEPFYENGESGTVKTRDDVSIFYKIFSHPDGKVHVLISHGWTEDTKKYDEVAYDLYQHGISTYILDYRGFGQSQRITEDPHISYIESYSDYLKDLDAFIGKVIRPRIGDAPLMALGHSMGSNILSIYAVENPQSFRKMVLVSPMLDIVTPYPERISWLISEFFSVIGLGDQYIPKHGPYKGDRPNLVTNSEVRFNKWMTDMRANSAMAVSGASFAWSAASLEATWRMKDDASKLKIPLFILQAGDDALVETEGQDYVCKRARNCFKMVFPNAKHELLHEKDIVRDKVIAEVVDYLLNFNF